MYEDKQGNPTFDFKKHTFCAYVDVMYYKGNNPRKLVVVLKVMVQEMT